MATELGRRRFIKISAAAGLGVLGTGLSQAGRPSLYRWRGLALGAEAEIILAHPDEAVAKAMVGRAVAEIARLEKVFSLYVPGSAVSRLNRAGSLDMPPPDLVRLIEESRLYHDLTEGKFDITVQPLWELYGRGDVTGQSLKKALAKVGQDKIEVSPSRIVLGKKGMALTFNGIAQGYITDRVADLLRDLGMTDVVIDLGEIRTLGRHPSGRAWKAGLGEGGQTVDLTNRGLATSSASDSGLVHLFDPRQGAVPSRYRRVSVIAKRATAADAFSTGMSFLAPKAISRIMAKGGVEAAYLTLRNGSVRILSA